jgi:hypothetical protein
MIKEMNNMTLDVQSYCSILYIKYALKEISQPATRHEGAWRERNYNPSHSNLGTRRG